MGTSIISFSSLFIFLSVGVLTLIGIHSIKWMRELGIIKELTEH